MRTIEALTAIQQEQRSALADRMGWKEAFPPGKSAHPKTSEGGILLPYKWINEITGARLGELPDYHNDYNNLVDVLLTMSWEEMRSYAGLLELIVAKRLGAAAWHTMTSDQRYYAVIRAKCHEGAQAVCFALWPQRWED